MPGELVFPSADWFRAAAKVLHADPAVQAGVRDFGAVSVGLIIEKGDGLGADFCTHATIVPGQEPKLEFPDDEDELEELEPAYLIRATHATARRLVLAALRGERHDPMQPILSREVKLQGDLQRLVRFASQHKGNAPAALPAIPTRTLR